ncbi:class I SAM-dependent methyltransferase [Cellulomonas citrea]|uniref:class I SAM-dependent methyltransferase n=1 Tax=Cellulomonas citrea TaxID=1909423 RepID=UPI0013579275|nr:class I SAM-dependent methyltransferase [Cellulomonas citrea]
MDRDRALATTFGAVVGEYEQGRPGYPDAVVDWLLPPACTQVLDLGAGTGKLTASLVARGLAVRAVEPSDAMRERLHALFPQVDARAGTAEQTGLPDACVDAVVVGQAWHWFDEAAAAREVARVLRPGGTLGLVWNRLDRSVPWVGRLQELVEAAAGGPSDEPAPRLGAAFEDLEQVTVTWTHRQSRESLRSTVASRSYVVALPDAERETLLGRVDELVEREVPPGPQVDVPYLSGCWRARAR